MGRRRIQLLGQEKTFIEHALPDIAQAVARSMSNARVNIIQGDGSGGTPFNFILSELITIMRERVERLERPSTPPPSPDSPPAPRRRE